MGIRESSVFEEQVEILDAKIYYTYTESFFLFTFSKVLNEFLCTTTENKRDVSVQIKNKSQTIY